MVPALLHNDVALHNQSLSQSFFLINRVVHVAWCMIFKKQLLVIGNVTRVMLWWSKALVVYCIDPYIVTLILWTPEVDTCYVIKFITVIFFFKPPPNQKKEKEKRKEIIKAWTFKTRSVFYSYIVRRKDDGSIHNSHNILLKRY